MTTASIIDERAAVQIAATLDPGNPDFHEALEIALARRGSRDALIATFAKKKDWASVLNVFHSLRSDSTVVSENVDGIYAIAHSIAGSPAIATAIARKHPDHKMLDLLATLIKRGIPVETWTDRLAALDLESCYQFEE